MGNKTNVENLVRIICFPISEFRIACIDIRNLKYAANYFTKLSVCVRACVHACVYTYTYIVEIRKGSRAVFASKYFNTLN